MSNRNYYDSYSDQISHAFEQLQKEVENDKTTIEKQKATIDRIRYSIRDNCALDKKYKESLESEKHLRQQNERLAKEIHAEKKRSSRAYMNASSLEAKVKDLEAKLRSERVETQRLASTERQMEIADLKRKFELEVEAIKAQYEYNNNNNINGNRNRNTYQVLIYDNVVNSTDANDNTATQPEKRIKDLEAEIKQLKEKNASYEKTIKEMSSKGLAFQTQLTSMKDMVKDMMANAKQDKTMVERMRSLDASRVTEIDILKRKYDAEVLKLTKQRKYQMDLNQKLKKKLLATQYTFGGHEMLRKASAQQLATIMRTNNRNMLTELKRSFDQAMSYASKKCDEQNDKSLKLVNESAQSQMDCIYKNAKEIVKTTSNCPDCARPFEDIASLKKHMTLFHMKQYCDEFNGSIVVERSPPKRKRTANNSIVVDVE